MTLEAYQPMLTALRALLVQRAEWLRHQWEHLPEMADVVTHAEVSWLQKGKERWATTLGALPDVPEADRLLQLGQIFGLDALERWTLFACLAPNLDPGLERLYAYAQDQSGLIAPTPGLLLSLFGQGEEGLASFFPGASLRTWRLLRADPAFPGQPLALRPLTIDDRITGFLLDDDRLDVQLTGLLQPIPTVQTAPSQEPVIARAADLLSRGPVNLIGSVHSGYRGVAAAAAARLKRPLFGLVLASLVGEEQTERARLIGREVALQGGALLIEAEATDPQPLLQELLHAAPTVLIASRERRLGTPLFLQTIAKAEQAAIWRSTAQSFGPIPTGLVENLVEQFDLAPESIAEIAASGDVDSFWTLCRERGRKALDGLAQRIESRATWADLVLPPETTGHLQEIMAQCRHRYFVHEAWGFGARLGRGRGVSALFAGPSGAGKTTAAEVLAGELQMDLYRIDLAGMVSKYIGETEKNLRRIFDAAEEAGAILFFDEADALFGKRSEVKDAHDRYANIEIDYLLQRMEAYRGVTILATNLRDALDDAFLRRLRFVIDFPFPEGEERLRLWERAFPPGAATDGLDLRWLARLPLTGGNISTIAVNAAFLAAGESKPIQMVHLIRAVRREYAKLQRPLTATELGPYAGVR